MCFCLLMYFFVKSIFLRQCYPSKKAVMLTFVSPLGNRYSLQSQSGNKRLIPYHPPYPKSHQFFAYVLHHQFSSQRLFMLILLMNSTAMQGTQLKCIFPIQCAKNIFWREFVFCLIEGKLSSLERKNLCFLGQH